MLKIRLARFGRSKRPFYRLVLTEHTKPAQSGFKEVLGRYDPLLHTSEIDLDRIKNRVKKGSQMSSRAAKIVHKDSGDDLFKKFFTYKTIQRKSKKEK